MAYFDCFRVVHEARLAGCVAQVVSCFRVLGAERLPWADRAINQCVGFPAGKFDDAVDMCALIARAIEQVHPARPSKPPKPKEPMDRWDQLFDDNDWEADSWKVM